MADKRTPAFFVDYPVFSVVALDEDEKILLGGGGGSSNTGVPNLLELYKIELVDGETSHSLLARHDFGKDEVVHASVNPARQKEVVVSVENSSVIAEICEIEEKSNPPVSVENVGPKSEHLEEEDSSKETAIDDPPKESEAQIVPDKHDSEGESDKEKNVENKEISEEDDTPERECKDGAKPDSDVQSDLFSTDDRNHGEGTHGESADVEDISDSVTERETTKKDEEDTPTAGLQSSSNEPTPLKGGTDSSTIGTGLRKRKIVSKEKKKIRKKSGEAAVANVSSDLVKDPEYDFAVSRKHKTDFADKEPLQKVAKFTFDGRHVVTGGADGHVRVWKYPTFGKVHELKGHDKEICDLDLHPTQSLAVSLSRGEKAIVWNVEEGEDVDSFMCQSKRGAEYWTRSCRFSPAVASDNDDDVVLHTIAVPLKRGRSSSLSSYLVQREVEEWSVTKTRAVTKEMLSALCVSRDGRLVAVGTAGGSVLVYSHDYQLLVKAPDVHSFSVTSLAVCSLSSGHGQTKPKRISNRKAVVSVSIDRTCCVTMVTKRKSTGTFSSLFCFAIIVLLLLTIWSLLYF